MKKLYKKPNLSTINGSVSHSQEKNVAPALMAGGALLGGYALGRVVKQIDAHGEGDGLISLDKVL